MNGDLGMFMQRCSERVVGICGTYQPVNWNRKRARVIEATLERHQPNVRETQESVMEL